MTDNPGGAESLIMAVVPPGRMSMTERRIFCVRRCAHESHETYHSVTPYFLKKKDSKRCCYITTLESIHTKDESKRGSAFAFICAVN